MIEYEKDYNLSFNIGFVAANIEGKKDNASVSILMKYDTYLNSRKSFSKKYETKRLSYQWMY